MTLRYIMHIFDSQVCIDTAEDGSFNEDDFLLELQRITGVKVFKKDNIYSSFGPLSFINRYSTSWGDVDIEIQMKMVEHDLRFRSRDNKLLQAVVKTMQDSSLYQQCKNYNELK